MLKFIRDKKKHIICLVGGGGKTTIMYELATEFAAQGRKVLVLTSTHILQPASSVYAQSAAQVQSLWQRGSYAVIGKIEAGSGKLIFPPAELYVALKQQADIILCEADGAKHKPCKLPAAHEPVLLDECDIVLAVAGADALGKIFAEACLRYELAQGWLTTAQEKLESKRIDAGLLARLLTDARGARKNVGARSYYVVVNKCDTITDKVAQELRLALLAQGLQSEKIWLRGLVAK